MTPNNILRRDCDQAFLVGDLMLAKALEGAGGRDITQPGALLGDLAYLAPERTYANATVDTRSDLYSLGATLYASMAGRPPFAAETTADLLRIIRDQPPWPPHEYQMSIHAEFEDVVLTLLAKKPERRFKTPAHLLQELERIGIAHGLQADR